MPFSSLITKFSRTSDIDGLIQQMFAHNKTQEVESPRMSESGFTLDKIMHLHINVDSAGVNMR